MDDMQKSTLIRLTALGFATAGLWVALTQQPPQELTVTKIADDLHVIVGSGGNVAVYTTDEGVILVDDKFEPNFPQIMAKVKGITDKPVRYVLNTHVHGDHTGGNAKFLGAGAEIIAHENAVKQMEEKKMPGVPRLGFSQRFSVRLGGKRVEARYFGRGHTNTDVFIYFPALKVVHTGDMVTNGAPLIDYSSGASGIDWTPTLDRAMAMDFNTVIPGHGPIMKKEDILRYKQGFENMKLSLLSMRKQGKTLEEATAAVKADPALAKFMNQRGFAGLWDELAK
jgi:glyoxylase-like metal-dependent hydrolase (beta-lactamase superfamily II)